MTNVPPDDQEILEREIIPLLFSQSVSQAEPTLVLLAGQHGAAAGRVIQSIQKQHPEHLAPLAADIIGAFRPGSTDRQSARFADQERETLASTANGLQSAIRHARERRFSLLLEGPFLAPATALGVARRFADSGYRVRVVAVGVRPNESLLATTSHYLQQLRRRRSTRFITHDAHDRSVTALSELIDAAEREPSIHRVSIIDLHGAARFDTQDIDSGALAALNAAQAERMSSLESAQWLSELRRITGFARSLRTMPAPLAESLIELHRMALTRVVPELPVPAGSEVVRIQTQKLATDLAELRAGISHRESEDVAAPTLTPPAATHDALGL